MMPCSEPRGLSHEILSGCGSFGSPSMVIWATVTGNDFFFLFVMINIIYMFMPFLDIRIWHICLHL